LEPDEGGGDGDDDWNNTNKDPIKDDGLPFACFLCRGAFQEPIVTSCGHYFCQRCILKNVQEKSTTACPICSKDTNGVFNHPMKLVAKKRRVVGIHGTWEEFEREMKRGK
jgi:RING finger protein 113A